MKPAPDWKRGIEKYDGAILYLTGERLGLRDSQIDLWLELDESIWMCRMLRQECIDEQQKSIANT